MIKQLRALSHWRPGALARQGGALLGWMLLRALAQVATIVLLARALSGQTYGEFVAIIAVAGFATPLVGLGLAHMVLRNAARDPAAAPWYLRRALLAWGWTIVPLAVAAVCLALLLLPKGLPVIAVGAAVTAELLAASLTELAARYRQAQHRPHSYGFINAGLPMIRLLALGLLVIIAQSIDIATLLWTYTTTSLGYLALLWPVVRPTPTSAVASATEAMPLTSGLPFSTSALAMRLQGEFNKPILAHAGFGLAGTYNIAQRAVDMASLPLLALQEALWPRLYAQKKPLQQLRRTGVALLLLAAGMGGLVWLLAPLLPVLVGAQYADTIHVLRLLAWLPLLQVLRNLLNFQLIHENRLSVLGWSYAAGALINITMVATLTPMHGVSAVIAAAYATEISMSLLLVFSVMQSLRRRPQTQAMQAVPPAMMINKSMTNKSTNLTPDTLKPWPADGIEALHVCPLCGSKDRKILYTGLRDRLFGAPGEWTLQRCNDCGFGYLDPRPSRQTIALAYTDYLTHVPANANTKPGILGMLRDCIRNGYLAHRYGFQLPRSPLWGYWVMYLLPGPIRWEQDHRARHLHPPTKIGMRLLDIGCGNGEFLLNARSAGWQVNGLEPDPKAAMIGASRDLNIHVGTYDSADYASASFDVITANQVIEHVHDPHDFVAHIYRWLKPGGKVWIGTPNLDCPMHARFGRNYGNLHPPQHLLVFSPATLRKLFSNSGFINIRFVKRGFHDYNQTLGSASLARGVSGSAVYSGVRNAPLTDHIAALGYELAAWQRIEDCSDLVMLAEKLRQ